MTTIALVAAVAANRVIGRDNRLIWRLKSDMKHFRALTMGRPVIMGRKTFESIGRPLPGRHTIVVTRDPTLTIEGVRMARSIPEAEMIARAVAREFSCDSIMVAGGAELYAAFLPRADRLDLTIVALKPEGDAWFPEIDPVLWREVAREECPAGPDDEAAFSFVTYERRRA